jgi:hypothetical protein
MCRHETCLRTLPMHLEVHDSASLLQAADFQIGKLGASQRVEQIHGQDRAIALRLQARQTAHAVTSLASDDLARAQWIRSLTPPSWRHEQSSDPTAPNGPRAAALVVCDRARLPEIKRPDHGGLHRRNPVKGWESRAVGFGWSEP